jgi:hypothetical protein
MRERVLAVIGAVCLIALAVVVRSALAGDDGPSGGDEPRPAERPLVACTPDLAEVCEALAADGRIAEDPPTLDLAGADAPDEELDGWITWDPAHQLADFEAGADVWRSPEVLANARLAVAGTADDLGVACDDDPAWSCVRDADAEGLAIGVGDPATAEGAARLLPVARTYATDDDPSTLERGLRSLIDGPVDGQQAAPAMARDLVVRPGRADLVVGPTPTLELQASTARGEALGLQVVAPSPAASATIVIVERTDGVAADVREAICDRSADELAETEVGAALLDAGGAATCRGDLIDEQLAGFLFQVREELS